jgi:hypothetical protein
MHDIQQARTGKKLNFVSFMASLASATVPWVNPMLPLN